MQKESNKFDFKIEKYISNLKKNSIIAVYEITKSDIKKNSNFKPWKIKQK